MQVRKFDGVAHSEATPPFKQTRAGARDNRYGLIVAAFLPRAPHTKALP